MSVAKTNASDKPTSSAAEEIQACRENLIQAAEKLNSTVASAAAAAGSFDQTERAVLESALQIGFRAMQLFVLLQGDGDLGEEVATAEGKRLRRTNHEPVRTTIRSIFGTHEFRQFVYSRGRNKKSELQPVSARMSLPPTRWSYLLQEFSQMLCVDQAYGTAMTNLGQILGGSFSVDTAQQINEQTGKAAGEFLNDLPDPEPASEGKFLVVSADGKGVPLVQEDAAKTAAFEPAQKKPGNRRMATVASAYSVDPHVRTADDVAAALFRDSPEAEPAEKPKRPLPRNKNTTAHFGTIEDDGGGGTQPISGVHVAIAWLIAQVAARRRMNQVLLVLMDGQRSLWETLLLHLNFNARTIPILDILHVLIYLWAAAGLFERNRDERKAFTRARLLRILRGEVSGVVRGLRQLGSTRKLSGKALRDLRRICGYLEGNADRMRYDEYLRRGYPISTGVIEGACRHLVKDRMERSGMRWTLEGARNMLHVRAAFQSDHWRTFCHWRTEKELANHHPHRDLLADYKPEALAC